MMLYELFDIVGKSLLGNDWEMLSNKLKETVDNHSDFVRSRYCRRSEGLVPNRDLGNIKYIILSYNDAITKEFIENNEVLTCQINWLDNTDALADEISFLQQFIFSKILVIETNKILT